MNEMVRDGRMKLLPYRDTVLAQIGGEPVDPVYDFEISYLNESTTSYIPILMRSAPRAGIF